ncbi:MAG: hypothetical protein AB7F67_16315 [Rhodospirillaceae bacterium]
MSVPSATATDRLYHPSPHPEAVADLMDEGSVATAQLWGDKDGPSFADLIDIINPLQHIPVVSTIYRAITGDKIGLGARLAGGALFGGPLGLISAGVMSAVQEATGKDTSEHLASLFGGSDAPAEKGLAEVEPAATAAPEPAAASTTAATAVAAATARPATAPIPPPTSLRAVQAARDSTPGPQPAGAMARANPLAALDRAKGAQAAMLAASLQATAGPAQHVPDEKGDNAKAAPQAAHANLPPTGVALPEWAAQAMERALDSYQRSGTLRRDTRPMVTITE